MPITGDEERVAMPRTVRPGASASPSMTDVAALAGVSHQTVSRVLNTPDAVRPETRRRVEEAIRRLGYRRNYAARALRTQRSGLVGVVSSGESYYGPSRMTMAIEEAARSQDYATLLTALRDARPAAVEKVLGYFLDHRVDGIIVIAAVDAVAEAAEQLSRRLPVVLVASDLRPAAGIRVVGVDQRLGGRIATRHLLQRGHRRILHVAGPGDWFDARGRVVGWREELVTAGLTGETVEAGWDTVDGYRVAHELVAAGELPDAIFAANDYLALGMIRAFTESGVRVPEDLSVIGFDDIEGAAYFNPPLTTVRQPFDAVGRAVVEVLLAGLGAESGASRPVEPVALPPELVPRSSSL
ncbi:LacI family DNA-binding transcriptional regulator [Georgenia alba]|uniref:LacI family DNA-binding transcriptional regulator n=1 Tax=Georgenia alba TaxID=2233858 RepID=A0ABW2QE73_9MICO